MKQRFCCGGFFVVAISILLYGCSTPKTSGIDDSVPTGTSEQATPSRAQTPSDAPGSEPAPEGEIDLEMGSEESDGEVVIESSAPTQKSFGASSVDEDSTCQAVSDCEGMDTLKCPGERFCEENKCVYRCYKTADVVVEDVSGEEPEEEEEAEEDGAEDEE